MRILTVREGLLVYPKDWPWFKQLCFSSWNDRCDMLVGPCACGAWHEAKEWNQFLKELDCEIRKSDGTLLADGNTPDNICTREWKYRCQA